MKKIPLTNLKAGMIFSKPVYVDEDNMLVPADIAIREKDLRQLGSWGVKVVETDGVLVVPKPSPEPGAGTSLAAQDPSAKTADSASPDASRPAAQGPAAGIAALYTDLVKGLNLLFTDIAGGGKVDPKSVDNLVARLFQIFRNGRDSIESFILGADAGGFEMAKSSVNSAILSVFIAQELKLPTPKIIRITAAALLHDAGMLRLPKELTEKRGRLSAAEIRTMQNHPVYSYQILTREIGCPEEIGRIARQHHEHWDGQGYPGGIGGGSIDLGARILSVADSFEAMISKRPYRNSMMGYEAMKNLLSDNQSRFDPSVLKAFVRIMGIHPIGSIVFLSNGYIGKVTEVRSEAPLRPKILILQDKEGNRQEKREILDLLVEKTVFITRALSQKEYPKERA
ncbi:MAG: HD domain-containing protein [Treponema sp.]|jgi:HD-GYP domain-containing protein (c-di-GMP phosphodiesterase class II)|nr:HD domain-containing protein [Treponema sp.]